MHDAFLPNKDELQDAKNDYQHVRTMMSMYGLRYGFTIVCYQPVSSMRKLGIWPATRLLTNAFSCHFLFSTLDFTEMFVNAYTFIVTQRIRVGKCKRVNKELTITAQACDLSANEALWLADSLQPFSTEHKFPPLISGSSALLQRNNQAQKSNGSRKACSNRTRGSRCGVCSSRLGTRGSSRSSRSSPSCTAAGQAGRGNRPGAKRVVLRPARKCRFVARQCALDIARERLVPIRLLAVQRGARSHWVG